MKLKENAGLRSNGSTTHRQLLQLALGMMTLAILLLGKRVEAQSVSTTTVQGTVYLANGQPGSGSVRISWPAFVTAQNLAITSGAASVTIASDGFLSVNLTPNQGASPAGLYYTAVYHLSDGTTSTEYWVVPAAAQASLSSVRAQVMPAAQAVQTVSKAYVDQEIQELQGSLLTISGGTLSGPLYLSGDPTQPLQAADKHYVDATFAEALPLSGGTLTGPLTGVQLGAVYQVDQFPGIDFGAKLAACLGNLNAGNGGTCDARNFAGTQTMGANLTISTADVTVQLPCAPISTAHQILVTAGTRNVALRGCAFRGTNASSGAQGGTVLLYTGTASAIQVGDPTYATDTQGFHLDNVAINTTASATGNTQGLTAFRSQEMDIEDVYLLGNSNQTGMTLDGTGNYTGGTFLNVDLNGFQQAINAVGHQIANPATTDWMNASTFVRLHIDCPTTGGNPIAGTYGINLQRGDGNTFTGGDVEGCDVALHLGANAQNNTIVGLRNENSNNQVVADTGSAYNNWMTGGTMFTGKLTDNGTRNSFLDTFHRSFNGIKGDWYGSQQDATVTNHYRLGTGAGNERGMLDRYQSDYGYRWTTGLSDATAGEQFYQVLDELNNVYRISIGQYNNGQSSTNNQTVINAAGTGAVVLNGSNGSGTGGVVFGSGGSAENTVATINSQGNAQFNGTLQVGGTSTFAGSPTVKNQADAEIDAFLWAGATTSQKESFIYKDWNGNSQWYMVKDASNNWALNSALGGLDSFKAYQSTNSGDTYLNASNSTGHIRLNYETGSGAETDIYAGSSASLTAAFLGTTAIKFPGLAAASGHGCLQIDSSGYLSNSGAACSAGGSGTVNAGSTNQIAYYTGNGTAIAGTSTVPVSAGGTGAASAAAALTSLGAQPAMTGVSSDGANGLVVAGAVAAGTVAASVNGTLFANASPFGAVCNGVATGVDGPAIRAALAVAKTTHQSVQLPPGVCVMDAGITIDGNSVSAPPNQSGLRVYGAGQAATFLYFPSVTSGAAINITQSGGNGLHLHDLSVVGPGTGAGTSDGIYNPWSNNLAIDHVAVTGFFNGIHLNGCGATCLIDTVSSTYNLNDGIFLDATSDASVTNSFLVYNGGDDIYLHLGDHALLSNNTIGVVSGTAIASQYQGNYGIHVVGATGTTAVANRIEGDVFIGSLSNPVYSWTVSGATWSGGVATYTTSATIYFATGDLISISGASPSGYNIAAYANGANCVATVTGPTTFTCPVASNPGTFSSSGTVTLIAGSHGVLDSSGNDLYLGNYFSHTDVRPASASNSFMRIDSYPSSVTPAGSGSYINGGTNTTPQSIVTAYDSSTGQSPSVSMGVTANGTDASFVGSLNNIPFSIKQNGIAVATATASLFTVNYGLTVTGSTILNGSLTANSTVSFQNGFTSLSNMLVATGLAFRSTTTNSTDITYTAFPNHTWQDPSNSYWQYAKLSAGTYPELQVIDPSSNVAKLQSVGSNGAYVGSQNSVPAYLISNNTRGLGLDTSGNVGVGSTTPTSDKIYWDVNGLEHNGIGTAIASAATIAPLARITHITGTTAIATITAPAGCATSGWSCQLTLIPDGLWTTTTAGNIAIASTAVVSKAEIMTYDPATAKWYPSY